MMTCFSQSKYGLHCDHFSVDSFRHKRTGERGKGGMSYHEFLESIKPSVLNIDKTSLSVYCIKAWNPACEEQCFDRCHRLGQTKDVTITKVSCLRIFSVIKSFTNFAGSSDLQK